MPYPILNLPYGLQQRFCELATPRERYMIQTAAGLMKHHLKPTQHTIILNETSYHVLKMEDNSLKLSAISHNGIQLYYFPRLLISTDLITIKSVLLMVNLTEADFYDSFFDHTLLKLDQLKMYRSSMSDSVLQRISSKCLTPVREFEAGNAKDCDAVNIGRLLELYPDVEEVYLYQCSMSVDKNWMKDIIKFKKRGLKKLSFEGTFDNIFNFNKNELVQLFMTQDKKFILILRVLDVPPANALDTLSKKIDKAYFETKRTGQCPSIYVCHTGKTFNDPNDICEFYYFKMHINTN